MHKCIQALSALLTLIVVLCGVNPDNPLDENGKNYNPPLIIIDTAASSIKNNDTIHLDSILLVLKGNMPESQFQVTLDNFAFTSWKPAGEFPVRSLSDGKHTIYISTMYQGGTKVFTDSIVFFVKVQGLDPFFMAEKDTVLFSDTGKTISLADSVTGEPPLKFQWYKDVSVLEGKTVAKLELPSLTLQDTGSYFCIASNSYGIDTSRIYRINIRQPGGVIKGILVSLKTSSKLPGVVVAMNPGNAKDTSKYSAGDLVTVLGNTGNLVKTGYSFVGWNTKTDGSGIDYQEGSNFPMPSTFDTLFAKWTNKPIFYTVKFNSQGGSAIDSQKVTSGDKVGKPTDPSWTGHNFVGWFRDAACTKAWDFITMPITADTTLFAQWSQVPVYKITFDKNDSSATGTMTQQSIASGSSAALSPNLFVKTAATFAGWATTAIGSVAFNNAAPYIMGTADVTLYAVWLQMFTLNITDVPEVGGSVTRNPNIDSYNSGATVTLTASASSGYRFKDWGMDLTGSINPSPITMTKNYTITANFIRQYTLTLSTSGNGSVNPSGNKAVDGDALTDIQATPNAGSGFYVWRVTAGQAILGDSLNAATTVKLSQGDATVQAVFRKTTFTKTYESAGASGYSVFQLPQDKGYMIAGTPAGSSNCTFVRTNKFGDSLWAKTYPCAMPGIEGCVKQTRDGGFIITGGASNKIALIKTDSGGVISWTRSLGQVQPCSGNIVEEISTGGFIIGGRYEFNDPTISGTDTYVYIMRTNSDATSVIFEKSFGYANGVTNVVTDIKQVGDNFVYYANTYSYSAGQSYSSVEIRKISGISGEFTWIFSFQNTRNSSSNIYPISDGYIISGSVEGEVDNKYDAFLAKIGATDSGAVIWKNLFGGTNVDDMGMACRPTTDGGYIIVGTSDVNGASDISLIKTDANGTATWLPPKTFGGSGNDVGYSVQQTSDGGFVLTGSNPNGMYLIKTDANGVVQ